MVIYTCRDDFADILCCAFAALEEQEGTDGIRLELDGTSDMMLFAEYRQPERSEEMFRRAAEEIRRRISPAAYEQVYLASLSREPDKGNRIYRFLAAGFCYGSGVMEMHHLDAVHRLFQICRFVQNESHLLTGFLRFSRGEDGMLFGRIAPENDVLPVLARHFSGRLGSENWAIYDERRKKAVLHPAGRQWFIVHGKEEDFGRALKPGEDEEEYRMLWRIFHETLAIPERMNRLCQQTHLPLRYRPFMTEFQMPEKKK